MGDERRPGGAGRGETATGQDRAVGDAETATARVRRPARVSDTLEPPPPPGDKDEDGSGSDG